MAKKQMKSFFNQGCEEKHLTFNTAPITVSGLKTTGITTG